MAEKSESEENLDALTRLARQQFVQKLLAKKRWLYLFLADILLFVFLFYVQQLLSVQRNLWVTTLILWGIINAGLILYHLWD